MNRRIVSALVLGAAVSLALGGCVGVKPWQRDQLARNVMALDSEGNISGYHDHVYFSKEASMGGRDANGGGCGCN